MSGVSTRATVAPIEITERDGEFVASTTVSHTDAQVLEFSGTGYCLSEAVRDLADYLDDAGY
jgi:hypothetical protein